MLKTILGILLFLFRDLKTSAFSAEVFVFIESIWRILLIYPIHSVLPELEVDGNEQLLQPVQLQLKDMVAFE